MISVLLSFFEWVALFLGFVILNNKVIFINFCRSCCCSVQLTNGLTLSVRFPFLYCVHLHQTHMKMLRVWLCMSVCVCVEFTGLVLCCCVKMLILCIFLLMIHCHFAKCVKICLNCLLILLSLFVFWFVCICIKGVGLVEIFFVSFLLLFLV